VTLLAEFAAERRAAAPLRPAATAVDRYLPHARRSPANPPHDAVQRKMEPAHGQMLRRTDGHRIVT